VKFHEVAGTVLYIGGSYIVMRRDSTVKSIPMLLLELAMFIRILARIWKGDMTILVTIPKPSSAKSNARTARS
jgi:uncharacterized membrane protein